MVLLISENSPARASLRFQTSLFCPRLYSIFREGGGAVGACTAHIDDFFECGELAIRPKVRGFL